MSFACIIWRKVVLYSELSSGAQKSRVILLPSLFPTITGLHKTQHCHCRPAKMFCDITLSLLESLCCVVYVLHLHIQFFEERILCEEGNPPNAHAL